MRVRPARINHPVLLRLRLASHPSSGGELGSDDVGEFAVGDYNGDQFVNISDTSVFIAHFGQTLN